MRPATTNSGAPAGGIPPAGFVGPVAFRGVERTRGELGLQNPAYSSAILWLPDGGTVKLYTQDHVLGDIMDDALQALETANHDVLGTDAVGPGESLAVLTR